MNKNLMIVLALVLVAGLAGGVFAFHSSEEAADGGPENGDTGENNGDTSEENGKIEDENGENNGERDGDKEEDKGEPGEDNGGISRDDGERLMDPSNEEVSYLVKDDEIILSWGKKPTGGYSITIEELEIKEGDLYVYYSLRSPKEDEMVTQVITYPKDAAQIPGDFEDVHLELLEEE